MLKGYSHNWYRLIDKYGKPVTTIVIFTDQKNFKPNTYKYHRLGTKTTFEFNTYKIIEQDEAALQKSKNPFATVVLTVLLLLKAKKLTDKDLYKLKVTLPKNLLQQKFSKKKISNLLVVCQLIGLTLNYLSFSHFIECLMLIRHFIIEDLDFKIL